VVFNESPKDLVTNLVNAIQQKKICDLGEKCPIYVYENFDGVGGKTGERIM
jgi:hypothetical protein